MGSCCGGGATPAYKLFLSLDGTEWDMGVQTEKIERVLRRIAPRWAGPRGVYDIHIEHSSGREAHGFMSIGDNGQWSYEAPH